MMGRQDDNREIQVAVLLSFLLQVLLIFLGPTRRRSSAIWSRLTLWSCYLLADSIAVLALGLILYNVSLGGSHMMLAAFWTPFLLLHPGAPDTITAYSLEDNELWLRHLVCLLFELFAAAVIFFCSLQQDSPMIHATVLVFVVGVIKYAERIYSLYSGSIYGFRKKILGPPEPGPNYAKLMTEFDSREKAGLAVQIAIAADGEAEEEAHKDDDVETTASNKIYDMVYTKAPVAYTRTGWVLRCVCSACLVSALLIFFFLDKPGHQIRRVDVGITYALLLGGVALDAAALLMIFFSDRAKVYLEESSRWLAWLRRVTKRWQTRRWWGNTSQLNLIGYCLGKPGNYSNKGGRRCLYTIAEKLHVEDIVDDLVFIRRVPLCKQDGEDSPPVLKFIFHGLKSKAGKEDIMEVCNCRGKRVIQHHATEIKKAIGNNGDINKMKAEVVVEEKFKLIQDSVEQSDFDGSLLMWHIATELCGLGNKERAATADGARLRLIAETLSEYMLYLLVKEPEMLSVTASIGLLRYRDTCEEARRFFGSLEAWIDGHDDARRMLLSVNTSEKPSVVKGDRSKSALFDGVILAKALRELDDEALMWEVITGVWGEMLTYAAAKCRGSKHVGQLSCGGELITLVWLLMAHMGLGDIYQIREGDAKAKPIVKDQ